MDEDEIDWETIRQGEIIVRRLGRLTKTGALVVDIRYGQDGRQVETLRYDDHGNLTNSVVYEHDKGRNPKLVQAYNKDGRLIFRHERGKRPEVLE